MPRTYHLFISHSWTYSDHYDRLCRLLNDAKRFSWSDYSVPEDDRIHRRGTDRQLYEAIKQQIAPSSVVLVLAGVYASYSKWIDKEITIAKEEFDLPKAILGIKPRGNTRVSARVSKNADEIVGWSTNSIVSGIRRLAG